MSQTPPNVLLMLTVDQGWGDLSRKGNRNLCTPRMDQLAADGAVLEGFAGSCCGYWSHYFDSTIERNVVEVKSEAYLPDPLTDQALAFIDLNRDQPFFCYVPLNTPPSPFQVPDETRSALAMCENIDWNVGRVTAFGESMNHLHFQPPQFMNPQPIQSAPSSDKSYEW